MEEERNPSPRHRPASPHSAVKQLVDRQEAYIGQLEREAAFCRDQLGQVLSQVREVLVAQGGQGEEAREELLTRLRGLELEVKSSEEARRREEEVRRREEEARQLREQSKTSSVPVSESPLVVELRGEVERLRTKEAEAADQVAKSVAVAEQLGAAKTEAEFEGTQLKAQVERQQGRIRGLIEEQCGKVEEERQAMERRWKEQVEVCRRETVTAREEAARGGREVDRLGRVEADLRAVAEERERVVARLREELERRLGELQREVVEATAARQAAEREANSGKLRGEKESAEARLEREGLVAEVESVRGRLRAAEETVVAGRKEQVMLVERLAGLEAEVAGEKRRRETAERSRKEEVAALREAKEEEVERLRREGSSRDKRRQRDCEQLEALVKRQSKITGELREQCGAVTARLETSLGEWRGEREELRWKLQQTRAREGELVQQVMIGLSYLPTHILGGDAGTTKPGTRQAAPEAAQPD